MRDTKIEEIEGYPSHIEMMGNLTSYIEEEVIPLIEDMVGYPSYNVMRICERILHDEYLHGEILPLTTILTYLPTIEEMRWLLSYCEEYDNYANHYDYKMRCDCDGDCEVMIGDGIIEDIEERIANLISIEDKRWEEICEEEWEEYLTAKYGEEVI